MQLVMFGKSRIDCQLDNPKRRTILQHNEKAKENKEIMKRLIDIICHLGKRQLALHGHDETVDFID
jgi:hypothetical protein